MKSNMTRRDVLKALGIAGGYATGIGAASIPSLGFSSTNSQDAGALVVIFQRGACDGFSVIAPNSGHDMNYYNNVRKGVGINQVDLQRSEFALADSGYSINPMLVGRGLTGSSSGDEMISVSGGLSTAIGDGKMTFFPGTHVAKASRSPFVGSMSHFVAQDILEYGGSGYDISEINQRLSSNNDFRKRGWIARTVNIPDSFGSDIKVFGFHDDKSLLGLNQEGFFVSSNPAIGIDLTYGPHKSLQQRLQGKIMKKNKVALDSKREEKWRQLQNVLFSSADDLNSYQDEFANTRKKYRMINNGEEFKPSGMAKVLSDTEVLLKNYPNLQFVTINQTQYDTHSQQNDRLEHLLKDLGDNLGVFYERMSTSSRRVQVIVVTEFGRTFDTNGSGTDHGQGYTLMSMSAGSSPAHQITPVYFGPDYGTTAPSLENNWIVSARGRLHVKPIQDYRTILSEIIDKRLEGVEANPFDAASPFSIAQSDYPGFLV